VTALSPLLPSSSIVIAAVASTTPAPAAPAEATTASVPGPASAADPSFGDCGKGTVALFARAYIDPEGADCDRILLTVGTSVRRPRNTSLLLLAEVPVPVLVLSVLVSGAAVVEEEEEEEATAAVSLACAESAAGTAPPPATATDVPLLPSTSMAPVSAVIAGATAVDVVVVLDPSGASFAVAAEDDDDAGAVVATAVEVLATVGGASGVARYAIFTTSEGVARPAGS
jgi:hypothetical protein